jgi:hypothetical protein
MEKFSSIERVVGQVSESEKKEIFEDSCNQFNDQYFQELEDKEREKTPIEIEIINLANQCTNEIRKKYGLPDFDIPAKNIHVIKKDKWPRENEDALYNSMMQAVALKETSAKIVFMKKIVHEMLHFKAYNALQVKNDNFEVDEYRSGLTVSTRDGERMYFRNFNEAVTEEMTKSILAKMVENKLFVEEIKKTGEVMGAHPDAKMSNGNYLFDNNTFYAELKNGSNEISTARFTKEKERKILNILIDKLFERNKENIKSRDEIFEMFSEAMMTGNIISIGKLIDNTFDKGTFRKIGELDERIGEQEKFVDSLE